MSEFYPEFGPRQTLWFLAQLLMEEDRHEIPEHLNHDCYAGMVIMQEAVGRLYGEEIPLQRRADSSNPVEVAK